MHSEAFYRGRRDNALGRLGAMIAIARFNGDGALVEELEGFRALIPNGRIDDDAWRLLDRMLTAKGERDCRYSEEALEKLTFAFELSAMCHDAVASKMKLPEDVQALYGKTPRGDSLGAEKEVGGAFAIVRGFRPNNTGRAGDGLSAAGVWAREAIRLGERFGIEFPGLGQTKAR